MKTFPTLPDLDNCSGCGACAAICAKGAITMHPNSEGFLHPQVNESKCVNCRLCERACPVLAEIDGNEQVKVYAAKNKSEKVRLSSTSGGVFYALANYILEANGIIYGVKFNPTTKEIVFGKAENHEQLDLFKGSKYVQANAKEILVEVKASLVDSQRPVLFSGTPCQIAGLKKLLQASKIDSSRLYTIEVICHGAASPLAWAKFISQFKNVKSVCFRCKRAGWHKYVMSILDNMGKEIISHFGGYTFLWGFLQSLYNRRSCQHCHFKHNNSWADFTLGDCWGIEKVAPEFDDDKGVSLVLVRTGKGVALWDSVAEMLEVRAYHYEDAIGGNPALINCVAAHPEREKFFRALSGLKEKRFDDILKDMLGMSLMARIGKKLKSVSKRLQRTKI